MIVFKCIHCGAPLQVKDNLAGHTRPCPRCTRAVQAPKASAAERSSTVRDSRTSTRASASPTEETSSSDIQQVPSTDCSFLAPPEGPEELGRLGPYLIRKILGVGAMGIVFEAQDVRLKRRVALKVMKPALAAQAEFHRRFLREAQLAAAIEHEHIITIFHVGEDRGIPFLAMKLLHGEALEDRLKRIDRLPPAEVLRIGREVAEGLVSAHDKGLVHRDIKPANIWLEEGRDRVKIVDFGLARGTGADAHFTHAGAVIGTPSYMAPEQANATEVDGRSDLFSLGGVLYRACTGQLPFDGKDTLSVLSALASKTPLSPRKLVSQVPLALSALIMRLLAKNPNDRPQSAREVVECIEAIERGESSEVEIISVPEQPPPPKESKPAKKPVARAPRPESASANNKPPVPAKRPPRASPKRKQPKIKSDWGIVVLIGSLVLLAVALVVLVLGLIHYNRQKQQSTTEAVVSLSAPPERRNGASPFSRDPKGSAVDVSRETSTLSPSGRG